MSRSNALLRITNLFFIPVLDSTCGCFRARFRMDSEDVLGQKISVGNPQIARSASAGVEIKQGKAVTFLFSCLAKLILLAFYSLLRFGEFELFQGAFAELSTRLPTSRTSSQYTSVQNCSHIEFHASEFFTR